MARHGAGAGVWPLPVFEPPISPTSSSRRLRQRFARAAAVTDTANRAIDALNTLSRSFRRVTPFDVFYNQSHSVPNQSSPSENFEARNPSSTQNRMLARVYQNASRFVSRRGALVSECDDPLFDSNLLSQLRQSDVGSYVSNPKATVVPVVADRIALPALPGTVDLLNILPPNISALYATPNASLFRPASERPPAPRVRRVASQAEWNRTVRKLVAADMVEFTAQPEVVCGVFAVPKDASSDRFIIDARPTNCVFAEPQPVVLPTPDLLSKLAVDPSRPLYVAKVDLDNFYHRLRLPVWMRPYFALPPVRAGDFGLGVRFGDDTEVYPCCKTLPMGWSHSVLLAQLAHEHFLDTATTLSAKDRITASNDPLVDRTRHQVYIDDLNLFDSDPVRLGRVQDEYLAAVGKLGLVVKQSKVVRPTADGVECVGLEVDGTHHTVGVSASKLERLRVDTAALLASNSCTGNAMSQLVGRWTWAMLAARPSLSVFNSVYRFIECAGGKFFSIWNSVKAELATAVGLAPLLFADIGADWFPKVVSSDASESGLGVAAAVCECRPEGLDSAAAAEQAIKIATESRWSTIVSARWHDSEHINVLELRALTSSIKWVCSHPNAMGLRVWLLCDSSVVVGAVSKGRSSSQPVLRRLRHLAAWLLASGLQPRVTWIPSASNPADEPSRRI